MKKKLLVFIASLCAIVALFGIISPLAADSQMQVSAQAGAELQNEILKARFLNMLNHNFVYNSDFDNIDVIVNNSMPALLELRDEVHEDYIPEAGVGSFVKDMYGIEITDLSSLNSQFPRLEGYVYIIPRGFTSYNHEMLSCTQNEDGTWSVVTQVTVDAHDGSPEVYKAASLFVENEESSFGYNIVYSDIIDQASEM